MSTLDTRPLDWWYEISDDRKHFLRAAYGFVNVEMSQQDFITVWEKETGNRLGILKQPEVKTVIKVDIHKVGCENDTLLRAVGNHNGGIRRFTANDLFGYVNVTNVAFPNIRNLSYKHEWPTTHISEDGGKTFTLSLTWNEVVELKVDEVKEAFDAQFKDRLNDLNNIIFH